MDNLRWILLAAGSFFVLVVYLLGKNRRQKNNDYDDDLDEESPRFSAKDWDEAEEGVGEVRIVARETNDADIEDDKFFDEYDDSYDSSVDDEFIDERVEEDPEKSEADKSSDVIVLTLIARSTDYLLGEEINSAAQANGLSFGKMNIFHRLDEMGQSIFSLANMVEPGSFDPDAIYETKTPGIILFMQVSAIDNPESGFDDMLQCAYNMSEMLDAQLCNARRKPLTQSDAEQYREIVSHTNA